MLVGGIAPGPFFEQWPFRVLCLLAAWLPAWLSADLLAIGPRTNPRPVEQWHPVELAARAVCRLAPAFMAMAIWSATLTRRILVNEAPHLQKELLPTQIAWTSVILVSSLAYAVTAALLSATSRRPNRLPLLGVMATVGTVCEIAARSWIFTGIQSTGVGDLTPRNFGLHALTPNLWVGVAASTLFAPLQGPGSDFALTCWVAAAGFAVYSLLLTVPMLVIAGSRYRTQRPRLRSRGPAPHSPGEPLTDA